MPLDAEPFAATYARLWQELRRREWVAYAENGPLDRAAIDRAILEAASGSGPVAAPGTASTADDALVERSAGARSSTTTPTSSGSATASMTGPRTGPCRIGPRRHGGEPSPLRWSRTSSR